MVRLVDSFPLADESSPWPRDPLGRFDLETVFVFGQDRWGMQGNFVAYPPMGWTWGDVEQAWSVLGTDLLSAGELFGRAPAEFWALREWGEPQ